MSKKLRFWWPETGRLTVKLKGNKSAVVRFFPSFKVIMETMRQKSAEAAYGDLGSGHQITHGSANEPACELSQDPAVHLSVNDGRTEQN